MKIFDLHCDTPYEMKRQGVDFDNDCLHISLSKIRDIEKYSQVMAFWSDNSLSDEECYREFFEIYSHFTKKLSITTGEIPQKGGFYLSIEDARLLCGDLSRLEELYKFGVRFIIPVWSGESCIGGAFDTSSHLTDFGRKVVESCFDKNIVVDISHCSEESADDIFYMASKKDKPVIASHSCAYSVYAHPRNLRDRQFERIRELGGVVGLSLCTYHLAPNGAKCGIDDVMKHIDHYLSLCGEDMICLGGDLDGAPLPDGINGIEGYHLIYDAIGTKYGFDIADKITYKNAEKFVNSIFKNER